MTVENVDNCNLTIAEHTPLWQGKLSLGTCPEKGRVLLAAQNYAQGETIIAAPALPISSAECKAIRSLELYKYIFYDPEKYSLELEGARGYLVFGPMSFCNHSDKCNARVSWNYGQFSPIVLLIAKSIVLTGQEITMRYANIYEYRDVEKWIS